MIRIAAIVLAIAGCNAGIPRGTVEPNAAHLCANGIATIALAMTTSDANAGGAGLMAIGSACQITVVPTEQTFTPSGLFDGDDGIGGLGTATCTATGCMFDHWGGSDPTFATWQTTGSITRTGDDIALDVQHTYEGTGGPAMAWTIQGSVTATNARFDGTIHAHGASAPSAYSQTDLTWDVDTDYERVVVDGTSCAIGGTLRVVISYADNVAMISSHRFDVQGELAFSSPCDNGR